MIIKQGLQLITGKVNHIFSRAKTQTKTLPMLPDRVQFSESAKFLSRLQLRFSTSKIVIDGQNYTKFNHSQMGSNPAFWAKNEKTGELFYIKYAQSPEEIPHLKEELTAAKLYKLAGFEAPEMELCRLDSGLTAIKSKYVAGLSSIHDPKQVQMGFAADAWLANWDSLINSNTQLQAGKPFKLDCGGALRFRAQGKLKPNFSDEVNEITSLLSSKNYIARKIYSTMTHSDLVKSFEKVCAISDKDIIRTVEDKNLAKTLINRKIYLSKILAQIKQTPDTGESLEKYFADIAKNINSGFQ